MKYRKKPVEVEAFKWTGGPDQEDDPQWIVDAIRDKVVAITQYNTTMMHIETLEGVKTANLGDYIIRGIQGEIYPCKPDIFEQTYESVTEQDNEIKKAFDDIMNYEYPPDHPLMKMYRGENSGSVFNRIIR